MRGAAPPARSARCRVHGRSPGGGRRAGGARGGGRPWSSGAPGGGAAAAGAAAARRGRGSPRSRCRPSPATGRCAYWYSLAATAAGFSGSAATAAARTATCGGACGRGRATGVAEHVQAFSTFGGWGAGDLIDAVLAPRRRGRRGLVGERRGGPRHGHVDPEGDDWVRRSSTGTPLQSARAERRLPTAATGFGTARMIRLAVRAPGRAAARARWCGDPGPRRRVAKTVLPDAGSAGTSAAMRCAAATCARPGTVDGDAGAMAPRRRSVEPRRGPPADPGGARPARRPWAARTARWSRSSPGVRG